MYNKLYHISLDPNLPSVLHPRLPHCHYYKEKRLKPRVCCARTLWRCAVAIRIPMLRKVLQERKLDNRYWLAKRGIVDVTVYELVGVTRSTKMSSKYQLMKLTSGWKWTREVGIEEPVEVKKVGTARVHDVGHSVYVERVKVRR